MDLISKLYSLKIIQFFKKYQLFHIVFGAIDIFCITLAFEIAYLLNYYPGNDFFFINQLIFFKLYLVVMPIWLLFLYLLKATEIPRTQTYKYFFYEYLQSAILITLMLLLAYFVFKLGDISRLFLLELAFIGFIFLFVARVFVFKIVKMYRVKGYNFLNILLIADKTSIPFIDELIEHKEWGYKILAIITDSKEVNDKYGKGLILIEKEFIETVNDLLEARIVDEVLYLKDKGISSEIRYLIRSCEELGVTFRVKYVPDKAHLTNAEITMIGSLRFLNFINIPVHPFALSIKNFMDITISLSMTIFFLPVMIIIAIIIKVTSPGPIIYKQPRVGLRGRIFNLYKFRTMVVDAEKQLNELKSKNEMDGPTFKIANDPRVTRIGRFLRKTGLDELPQLINILKGEMSLIGPRPPLESETKQYKRWQLRRLSVKPGLSCFWQIKPERNSIKFDKWMELDLLYIDNWSPRLDFLIFFKTILTVFRRTGL